MKAWKWFNPADPLIENKKKYKRLAFEHHPDRNGESPAAKAIFQEIQEEYNDLEEFFKTGKSDRRTDGSIRIIYDFEVRMDGVYVKYAGGHEWHLHEQMSGLLPKTSEGRFLSMLAGNLLKNFVKNVSKK